MISPKLHRLMRDHLERNGPMGPELQHFFQPGAWRAEPGGDPVKSLLQRAEKAGLEPDLSVSGIEAVEQVFLQALRRMLVAELTVERTNERNFFE